MITNDWWQTLHSQVFHPIDLYHAMLNKRFCMANLSFSARLDVQKQSFLFPWDSKWPPRDKGLYHHGQSRSTNQIYNIIDWQTLFTGLWRWLLLRLSKCQSLFSELLYPHLDDHTLRTNKTIAPLIKVPLWPKIYIIIFLWISKLCYLNKSHPSFKPWFKKGTCLF